jgi:predicted O-methyltransferase YrrM
METLEYIKKKYKIDSDEQFIKLQIQRNDLTLLWAELDFAVGAEIGVARGLFSKWICANNWKVKLYLIDPYKAYPEYLERNTKQDQANLGEFYEHAKERLARFNVQFILKPSMEAVKGFKDESLDFVYIDANHTFEFVVNDIAEWSKKVRKGGIVAGHDYWLSRKKKEPLYIEGLSDIQKVKLVQVKDAVDAWVTTNEIKPLFHTRGNSWFYVK